MVTFHGSKRHHRFVIRFGFLYLFIANAIQLSKSETYPLFIPSEQDLLPLENGVPPESKSISSQTETMQSDGTTIDADWDRHLKPIAYRLTAPTRKCGEVITTVSLTEVLAIAQAFLSAVIPPGSSFGTLAQSLITQTLKYSVQAIKICSSCRDVAGSYRGESFVRDQSEYGFGTFCGKKRYGYGVTHSGLLLLPIDPTTGKVFTGNLRSQIITHGTTIGSQNAPSGRMPSNVTAALINGSNDTQSLLRALIDIFPGISGAASGAVSVVPDYIGYGEAYKSPKSFLVYSLYQQASVVLWLAARQRLLTALGSGSNRTCTAVSNVVSVSGYSEGGYAALSTCLALNQLRVSQSKLRVLRCQVGGAPIDVDYVSSYILQQIQNRSQHPTAPGVLVFLGYAYSSTNPDLVNSGKRQNGLANRYLRQVPLWQDQPTLTQLLALLPSNPLELANPNFVNLYLGPNRTNLTPSPACAEVGVKQRNLKYLCQALVDNVLVKELLSAKFPVVVCHSPDDRLVPFANLPDFSSNPNVTFYAPPIPQLNPSGDHGQGNVLCLLGLAIAFALPADSSDTLQQMTPLTNASICQTPRPTTTTGKGKGKGKKKSRKLAPIKRTLRGQTSNNNNNNNNW